MLAAIVLGLAGHPLIAADGTAAAIHAIGRGGLHTDVAAPASTWNDLMAGNQRFVEGHPKNRDLVETRKKLVKGQHPRVIVLTCADSRVCPELIFDQTLGDLFVVRTAGNIADPVALGSIEYAVEHLHANVLVILGHEKCGAIAAAASGEPMPTKNLEAIVNKIAPALRKIKTADPAELAHKGVEANVHCVCEDLLKNSGVVRKSVAGKQFGIIKAVYRLESGRVDRLDN